MTKILAKGLKIYVKKT